MIEGEDIYIEEDEIARLYELAYHLVPTLAEESLDQEVSRIRDMIEKKGGTIISEEVPQTIELAYPLSKKIDNKNVFFDSAHFGWVVFRASVGLLDTLKKTLDEDDSILRFLLIKTEEDKVGKPSKKMRFLSNAREDVVPQKPTEPIQEIKKGEKKLTEAELDKTIEELIVD